MNEYFLMAEAPIDPPRTSRTDQDRHKESLRPILTTFNSLPSRLELLGAVEIAGVADSGDGKPVLPRFAMVAYTGGAMRITGWRHPVIVDLAGLAIPSQSRPIRFGHDMASGVGHWYKAGKGLLPIRWVFVHDLQGTHRDEYFYATDPSLRPEQIITWLTARWPIETTFQEVRAHLGFETPRQRVAKSVLGTAPCLLGLFSVVCLIFAAHARRRPLRLRTTVWYLKTEPTFSDALATV